MGSTMRAEGGGVVLPLQGAVAIVINTATIDKMLRKKDPLLATGWFQVNHIEFSGFQARCYAYSPFEKTLRCLDGVLRHLPND